MIEDGLDGEESFLCEEVVCSHSTTSSPIACSTPSNTARVLQRPQTMHNHQ